MKLHDQEEWLDTPFHLRMLQNSTFNRNYDIPGMETGIVGKHNAIGEQERAKDWLLDDESDESGEVNVD